MTAQEAHAPAASASGGVERAGVPLTQNEAYTGDPVPCFKCKKVPNVSPATSRRSRSGLTRGLCNKCYAVAHRERTVDEVGLPARSGRPLRDLWSRMTDVNGYITVQTPDGIIHEHRHVMQVRLGRKLVPGENVHHLNGKRDDNRLENLELWMSPQPYGQRVENLIQYMAEYHADDVISAIESMSASGAK